MIPHLRPSLILLFLVTVISGCSSTSREVSKTGAVPGLQDASSISGTYANLSHGSRPNLHLWEMVTKSPTKNRETDRVQLRSAGPGKIEMRLLRDGRPVDEAGTAFSPRGNHLRLRSEGSFKLLPFGFGRNRQIVSVSRTPDGELVVVSHSSFFGLVLFCSAGDSSTHACRFARVE